MAKRDVDWAKALLLLGDPSVLTFKQLKVVCGALGAKPKNRAEAEAVLSGASDLDALTKTQKEEVMVALGIHQPPAPAPVPDPAAQTEPPADEEAAAEAEEEETPPPPARRRFPLWGWIVIVFLVLAMALAVLGVIGSAVLKNVLSERSGTGIVATPTPMVVVATPVPTQAVATEAPAGIEPVVVEADSVFHFTGSAPAYNDFRTAVRMPGDKAVFVWSFDTALDGAVIKRIWPDDILISATLLIPGQEPQDLTELFGMFFVPANGTGDPALDAVLKERGVNIVDGEILMQNKYSIALGNVPAGSKIVFEIKDDENKAVNRGIGVVIDQTVDDFTITLK